MEKYNEKIILMVLYLIIILVFSLFLFNLINTLYDLNMFKKNSLKEEADIMEIVDKKRIKVKYIIENKVYINEITIGEKAIKEYSNKSHIYVSISKNNYNRLLYNVDKKIYKKIFYILVGVVLVIWLLHYVIDIYRNLK